VSKASETKAAKKKSSETFARLCRVVGALTFADEELMRLPTDDYPMFIGASLGIEKLKKEITKTCVDCMEDGTL
jgi:hypothetical protein